MSASVLLFKPDRGRGRQRPAECLEVEKERIMS